MRYLVVLMLLAGCATTTENASHSKTYADACRQAGGVLYKGAYDRDFICTDADSVSDSVRRFTGIY